MRKGCRDNSCPAALHGDDASSATSDLFPSQAPMGSQDHPEPWMLPKPTAVSMPPVWDSLRTDLLAVFLGEGERDRLRPALLSRERERDLERDPLELQEELRWPGLGEGLFLRSEACRECLADDSELLLGRPRWCLSFTLQRQIPASPCTQPTAAARVSHGSRGLQIPMGSSRSTYTTPVFGWAASLIIEHGILHPVGCCNPMQPFRHCPSHWDKPFLG